MAWREERGYPILRRILRLPLPRKNTHCTAAIQRYRACLSADDTFTAWMLEDFLTAARQHTHNIWPDLLFDRYLNFEKLERD